MVLCENKCMRYLSMPEFESLSFETLTRAGIPPGEAREVISRRYPMCSPHVIMEFRARGLDITLAHVEAYMLSQTSLISRDRTWKLDGGEFIAEEVWFGRDSSAALWEFCLKVGAPSSFAETPTLPATVEDMLGMLRSEHQAERTVAGCLLAQSIGAGLAIAGEHREDVEFISGPAISDMLGRAIAGESAAVDWLEATLVNQRPAPARKVSAN